MRDILSRYGLRPNRAGFIQCPFHNGDHTASMKIYKDSYHCFGCGAGGDVFSFVQKMDGLSFKDAYIALGGEYASMQEDREVMDRMLEEQRRRKKAAKTRQDKRQKLLSDMHKLNEYISLLMRGKSKFEPFSDIWCDCVNELETAQYRYQCLEEEVSRI